MAVEAYFRTVLIAQSLKITWFLLSNATYAAVWRSNAVAPR
ncbi:hypothetical protein [Amazonocrinis nigriterrae]|nr:hypothetical protein [Amazonocrinis nigriterrae]